MTRTLATKTLDRLMEPVGRALTPELARELVELRADAVAQARIDDLAGKCNEGTLSVEELAEYDEIVGAIHLIGILQRKARRYLSAGSP